MLKRKEFILGAAVGLTFAAAATAGGVISWPGAHAAPIEAGRIVPSSGAAGAAFAPPQGAPLSFAQIFDQVAPAVVQINTETRIERPRGGGMFQIPGTPFTVPLPQGATPDGGEGEGEDDDAIMGRGAGSGFFISRDGYIVTNNHVIENASEITVVLSDQREMPARVVGRDEGTDLAVLKVDGNDFSFVAFEEENDPRVGDWVIAVGNPFGLGGTATAGIVSARGRNIPAERSSNYVDYLQIDAAINTGNSGGPTFDIYGRVIGVNTAIYSPTGNSVGIGFAIPVSVAKPIVDRLMRGEAIQRGYIGVTVGTFSREMAEGMGLPADQRGAFINDVNPGGPGERGGLRAGDVVTAINGQRVNSNTDLTRQVAQVAPGQTLRLDVLRDGRRQTVTIRADARPPESELNNPRTSTDEGADPAKPTAPTGQVVAGLNLADLTPALRQRYGIPADVEGAVVTGVARGGDRRFTAGIVITRAGQTAVRSVADVRSQVEAARQAGRKTLFLLVRTPQGNAPVVLDLPDAE
ncbi:MAG: trypsin-like peptidase domain-containing protein [Brevundimonas sp.]|uniref:trypsin-like peptidase domain-containing protein n=1 Tax=Brevundimonas sp. TaxID=1871086 RepID=UPI0025C1D7A5|nr:trypsin-like peptidase domain-containing protein [Brevundimonas sp.]MBX3477946.1 trypsin-like peptidase domain-containing protein [Brevundimonas sp.]